MGRPKLLNVFVSSPDTTLYTKTPSLVTVVKSNTNLVVQETITSVQSGSTISFISPCGCSSVSGVTINSVTYQIVEASGNVAADSAFSSNALVTLTLVPDENSPKAYIQNSAGLGGSSESNIYATAEAINLLA